MFDRQCQKIKLISIFPTAKKLMKQQMLTLLIVILPKQFFEEFYFLMGFYQNNHFKAFLVLAGLSLLIREDVAFVIFMFGLVAFWDKKKLKWIFLVGLLAISACTPEAVTNGPEEVPATTATLPNPQVHVTPAPDLDNAATGFMRAWQDEDYAEMYGWLASEVRR